MNNLVSTDIVPVMHGRFYKIKPDFHSTPKTYRVVYCLIVALLAELFVLGIKTVIVEVGKMSSMVFLAIPIIAVGFVLLLAQAVGIMAIIGLVLKGMINWSVPAIIAGALLSPWVVLINISLCVPKSADGSLPGAPLAPLGGLLVVGIGMGLLAYGDIRKKLTNRQSTTRTANPLWENKERT